MIDGAASYLVPSTVREDRQAGVVNATPCRFNLFADRWAQRTGTRLDPLRLHRSCRGRAPLSKLGPHPHERAQGFSVGSRGTTAPSRVPG
jgi:hypothetical protein